ncbi:hypothetical protein GCM10027174_38070 [Salinifilum aidingensis]
MPFSPRRRAREFRAAPPVVLTTVLVALAVLAHGVLAAEPRWDPALHGGRLSPVADWSTTWRDYLASWHAWWGGTAAPAPVSLLVLALLGTVLAGPATVAAGLLLLGMPLAGLSAYLAARAITADGRRRAVLAGAYAVFPAAAVSAGQGRLDVVVAHVLVPPVLAGLATVLGAVRPQRSWLTAACRTALAAAALGAFAPLLLLVLLALAVLAFVLVPAGGRAGAGPDGAHESAADVPAAPRERAAGLVAVVVLSLACLLPWLVSLPRNPGVLLHGLGTRVREPEPGGWLLLTSPDGSVMTWFGVLLPLAALAAVLGRSGLLGRSGPLGRRESHERAGRGLLPPILLLGCGWVLAAVVGAVSAPLVGSAQSSPGWTGGPLVLVAAGSCWALLRAWTDAEVREPGSCEPARSGVRSGLRGFPGPRSALRRVGLRRAAGAAGVLLLGAAGAVAASAGPLRAVEPLDRGLASELAGPGSVLLLDAGGGPRLVREVPARYGVDGTAPVPSTSEWVERVERRVERARPQELREAVATARTHGVGHLAVRDPAPLLRHAGDLVSARGKLPDGRSALGLEGEVSPVRLLGPDLSRQSRLTDRLAPRARPREVPAELDTALAPGVTLRVSDGGAGRQLVFAAADEPGWWARVDGEPVGLAGAWGGQLAVPLPEHAARVELGFAHGPRVALLVAQAAAIAFTAAGALPERRSRRGPQRPSITSGSSPR